jgi:hypothetical protein
VSTGSAEVFLQRRDHADRAKSIPGDERTFRIGRCMLAYPFSNAPHAPKPPARMTEMESDVGDDSAVDELGPRGHDQVHFLTRARLTRVIPVPI